MNTVQTHNSHTIAVNFHLFSHCSIVFAFDSVFLVSYMCIFILANVNTYRISTDSWLCFFTIGENHRQLFLEHKTGTGRSVYADSYRSALVLGGVLSHIAVNPETTRFVTRLSRLGFVEKTAFKNHWVQMLLEEGTFTQIAFVR